MFKAKSPASYKPVPGIPGLKTGLLLGLLCLSLLFVQAVDLTHSHDGDLQSSFDCEICLKAGSLEDLAVNDDFKPSAVTRTQIFEASLQSLPFFAAPSQTARAPPAHV